MEVGWDNNFAHSNWDLLCFYFQHRTEVGCETWATMATEAVLKSTVRIGVCFLDAAAWTRWSEPWFWKEQVVTTATSGKRNLFLIPRSCWLPSLLQIVVKRDCMIAPWLLLVCSPLSFHAPRSLPKTLLPKADVLLLLRGLWFFTISNVCILSVCNWSACVRILPITIFK